MGKGKDILLGERRMVLVIAILLASSTLASLAVLAGHGRHSVGIVLVDVCDEKFAFYAKEGLDRYGDYFSTTILEERLNSSGIGIVGDLYMADDFNDPDITGPLREAYGVDFILIITHLPIGGEEEKLYSYWGKANTASNSAVMTVWFYIPEDEYDWTEKEWKGWDRQYTQSVAVHEVGHLLGFKHDIYDDECVMMFGSHNPEYCAQHEFELSYRTSIAPLGYEREFHTASFLINSVQALFFLPYLMVFTIILSKTFTKYLYSSKGHQAWPTVATSSTLAYFVLMVANSIAMGVVVVLMFAVLVEFMYLVFRGWREGEAPSEERSSL